MFSRFGPAARRVLRAAEQECRNHNHYYVGAEHVLLALLEEGDPAVDERLRAAGVDVGEVHAAVKRSLGTGDDRSWEGILVTPRVRKIVALAEATAADGDVEPIHLLDALQSERGSVAAALVREASRNPAGEAR